MDKSRYGQQRDKVRIQSELCYTEVENGTKEMVQNIQHKMSSRRVEDE